MLLDAGADKTLTNDLGEAPYDWAVKFEAPAETLAFLTVNGLSVQRRNAEDAEMPRRFNYDPGYEPLWTAIV